MHKTQRKAPVASSEDHQWVRAFTPGMVVRDVYAVDSASKKEARNGPFWAIELKDATGTVSSRIWSPLSQQFDDIPSGSLVAVEAKAERYREQMQLSIIDLRILEPEELDLVDTSIFMPASARSPLLMLEELEALAADVLCHEPWLAFISSILRDQEVRTRLLKAPAARGIHHARAGGLLEHILGVTRLCLHFAELYPQLDRQALFAGAVCHDMGKLWELTSGLSVDYTDEGRLAGHIFLGIEYLLPHMEAAKLGPDQKLHLQHLILSHHGQYEYGSPRLPQTAEAIALHYADNMDAKMDQCRTLFTDMAPETGAWSPYQKSLERAVYRAPRTPGADDITDNALPQAAVSTASEAVEFVEPDELDALTEPDELAALHEAAELPEIYEEPDHTLANGTQKDDAPDADGFPGLAELVEMEERQAQENSLLPPLTNTADLPDVPEDFFDAPDAFSDDDYPDSMLPPDDEECIFEHLTDDGEIDAVLTAGDETTHFMLDDDRMDEPVDPPFGEKFEAPQAEPAEIPVQAPVLQAPVKQEPTGQGKTRVEVRQCSLL